MNHKFDFGWARHLPANKTDRQFQLTRNERPGKEFKRTFFMSMFLKVQLLLLGNKLVHVTIRLGCLDVLLIIH